MDSLSVFSLKPIGYMKSVFHFKNGTPRQSSLCKAARGILTIEKSIFNNPEHSLDGLQEFSHAWIIFVFHKNNNAYSKAKVRPPRLNGRKMGIFSTRSPYRPNNVGLSLAKIDLIEGSSIHLSGIDILDGTPVLDIKPYIPEYDAPLNTYDFTKDQECVDGLECEYNGNNTCPNKSSVYEDKNIESYVSEKNNRSSQQTSKLPAKAEISNYPSNSKNSPCCPNGKEKAIDLRSGCESENCGLEFESSFLKVAEGFYTMSSALDRACTKISSEMHNTILSDERRCKNGSSGEVRPNTVINSSDICLEEPQDTSSDQMIDSLVDNVIANALSQMHQSDSVLSTIPVQDKRFLHSTAKMDHNGEISPSRKSHSDSSKSFHNKLSSEQAVSEDEMQEIKTEIVEGTQKFDILSKENKSSVTAPWLLNPPTRTVKVSFTPDALDQLESFSKNAVDSRFQLQMLSDPGEAKAAVSSIIHQDPRSVYRRQHCKDSLYFFTIDALHVTCWFDEAAAQVVRIKPVMDVPLLNCGEKQSSPRIL